ncbi:hypothetical protein [Caulobacter sp.]|uniref:hypothetical protein n=1 Tax=Caulobacter sp. TaxID=78 RepID=UPI0031E049D2
MSVENQTPEVAPSIPASAYPPGVDPVAYAAQMAEKVTAPTEPAIKTVEELAASRRPEGVPEKFWDAANSRVNTDALLKSYTELEKMKGAPAAPETPAAPVAELPAQPEDSPKITPAAPEGESEKPPQGEPQPVAAAIQTLTSKFEAGDLGDADFAAAEAAGLPRGVVETYFAGLKALEAASTLAAHEVAGGKDAFETARSWAASGLTPAELTYYNDAVGDPKTSKQAVEWLVGKHRAANPTEGTLLGDTTPAVQAGDVFTSQAQVTAAMASAQYRTDPAFRNQVAEKLARSRASGSLNMAASYHSRTR